MVLGNLRCQGSVQRGLMDTWRESPAYSFALRARTSSWHNRPYTVDIVLPWLVILVTVSICVTTPLANASLITSLKHRVPRGKSGSHEKAVLGSFRYS